MKIAHSKLEQTEEMNDFVTSMVTPFLLVENQWKR